MLLFLMTLGWPKGKISSRRLWAIRVEFLFNRHHKGGKLTSPRLPPCNLIGMKIPDSAPLSYLLTFQREDSSYHRFFVKVYAIHKKSIAAQCSQKIIFWSIDNARCWVTSVFRWEPMLCDMVYRWLKSMMVIIYWKCYLLKHAIRA